MTKTYIKIRTEFEGWHRYPGAGDIDPRIKFLESVHRHIFKVEVKMSVTHLDRELEFFICQWALASYLQNGDMDFKSCEMIATEILENHLIPSYGSDRYYEIVVSEDGENDGIVEYTPEGWQNSR
jgi:hypothetical protein